MRSPLGVIVISGDPPHFGHLMVVNPFCRISFLALFANIFGLLDASCDFPFIASCGMIPDDLSQAECRILLSQNRFVCQL